MWQALVKVGDREAAILTETDDRPYRFDYLPGYADSPVSLTMPVAEKG